MNEVVPLPALLPRPRPDPGRLAWPVNEVVPLPALLPRPRPDPGQLAWPVNQVLPLPLVALLSTGFSRRVAARIIGCAPSTITRTAGRDAIFADQVARAEHATELTALRLIHQAAGNDRYWRAAAWLLERTNPDDFAPRRPRTYTPNQVTQLVTRIVDTQRRHPAQDCRCVRSDHDPVAALDPGAE